LVVGVGLAAPLVASCGGSGTGPSGTGGANVGSMGGSGGDCSIAACPAPGALNCAAAISPAPLVSDFSACTWHSPRFGLCPLTGTIYPYAGDTALPDGGTPSSATSSVDTTAQAYHFTAMVAPSGYAGAGMQFDSCSDLSAFTGIQFTLAGTTDCALELQFATFSQRPTSQPTLPGGCDPTGSCYNYPVVKGLMTPTDATPIPIMVPFSSVTNWSADTAKEVVGLQWQATSPPPDGGDQPSCMVDLRIDNIKFY
jgi:hypothetical protein